ncbi:branched-chain amino acid ABC transporter permease [Halovenus salina]|uniref:Branched-chain amino acid ABC transporter permease n=1 Tax=Halovenus salina TaxID=1510225 RepID=A0ABD5W205_9EURY
MSDASTRLTETVTPTRLGWLAFILLLAVVPAVTERFWLQTFVQANIFALFVLSWNLISGQTSYISFGHSFLIGVAAYTTAILAAEHGVSPVVSASAGIGLAVLAGTLVFLPTLRLKGVYFTFVSLLLPIIGERVTIARSDLTGGERGIVGVPQFVDSLAANYYLSAVLLFATAYGTWWLVHSKFGEVLAMIRQDEELVETSGINPEKFKFVAFVLSAFVAGVAGVLNVHYVGTATIGSVLALPLSINIVIAAVIGGRGSVPGAIAGAWFYIFFNASVRPFTEAPVRLLSFYIVGILVIGLFPAGLFQRFGRPSNAFVMTG